MGLPEHVLLSWRTAAAFEYMSLPFEDTGKAA
jgi:hypothetical protein